MTLTCGSLFTGIGGLDMALEACGVTPIWQVEVDSFCNSILERHWPNVRRYGDIRAIDWSTTAPVDLICGGFPCQPFSVAGQNRGEDDERNMWPETFRAVREVGPDYVFLENVPGLLAHEYFGTILGDLAEGGYDAVWDTFTAAEVGAPHRRERLFVLAHARHDGSDERGEPAGRGPCESRSQPSSQSGILAHSRRGEYERRGGPRVVGISARPGEGDGTERQRLRSASPDRGPALADGGCKSEQLREWREGDESPRGGVELGHTKGERGQGGAEPAGRTGQALPRRSGAPVADTEGEGRQALHEGRREQAQPRPADDSGTLAVTESSGLPELFGHGSGEGQPRPERGLFPPGPDDRDAWARVLAEVPALEPALCRVATGVPDRTHRLRALGNAVVPAQGAYAFRMLWQRMGE